jgi:hypothetical protein
MLRLGLLGHDHLGVENPSAHQHRSRSRSAWRPAHARQGPASAILTAADDAGLGTRLMSPSAAP